MKTCNPSIATIDMSDAERKRLEKNLARITYPASTSREFLGNEHLEPFVSKSFKTVVATLNRGTLDSLLTLKSSSRPPAALVIRNCPCDSYLPDTPRDGKRDNYVKPTSVSEAFLAGVACILGDPIGHTEEKNGALLHDIVPVQDSKVQLSNEGSTRFDLHSENASFLIREKYILLLGLRSDHERMADTPIADVRVALQHLAPDIVETLFQKEFVIRRPYILDGSDVRQYSEPVALLTGPAHAPEIRASLYQDGTRGLTDRAEKAKQAFALALEASAVPLKVTENTLVIIHNFLCLHGRSGFKPRFDGRDRHLLRSYVMSDLWPVRALQTHATRILERSKAQ